MAFRSWLLNLSIKIPVVVFLFRIPNPFFVFGIVHHLFQNVQAATGPHDMNIMINN
jgi:hypothetical protein